MAREREKKLGKGKREEIGGAVREGAGQVRQRGITRVERRKTRKKVIAEGGAESDEAREGVAPPSSTGSRRGARISWTSTNVVFSVRRLVTITSWSERRQNYSSDTPLAPVRALVLLLPPLPALVLALLPVPALVVALLPVLALVLALLPVLATRIRITSMVLGWEVVS